MSFTLGAGQTAHAQTTIAVDATRTHQTMFGFGATTLSLAYGAVDNVPANLRTRAIEALYRDVRLNTGFLGVEPSEASAANVFAPANDNDDPNLINPAGFNWIQSKNMYELVVTPGRPYGFTDYFLGPVVQTGFALGWVNAYRESDYNRYLDEIAEHVLATALHWRNAYSVTPELMMPFNEPTSGNGELVGGNPTVITDIVKRAGARLRAGGFANMRFVIPSEEREDISLDRARKVLADASARPYVGALGYHPYPYGSTYAAVSNILATSGTGNPDAAKVALRNQLRDLGAMHNVPVFMTEVSHSEKPFDDFDNVRGRAVHIHDELVYANAAAFFGMNAMWDTVSHAQHYEGRADPGFYNETDTIVLIDVEMDRVLISPMGRAIGHYARWLRRGSTRVDATVSDPLVLVTAFSNAAAGSIVLVAVNNATTERKLDVAVSGVELSGAVEGELSKLGAFWTAVTGATASGGRLKYTLPARAVVTLSAGVRGAVPDAGAGGNAGAGTGVDGSAAGSAGHAAGGSSSGTAGNSGGGASGASAGSGGSPDHGACGYCVHSASARWWSLLPAALALFFWRRRR